MDEYYKRALEEALGEDEHVLWESGTQPFRLLDGKEGRNALLRWIACTALAAAFIAVRAAQGELTAKALAIVLLVYIAFMAVPLISYRQLLGQRYYLTDRRAIAIKRDGTLSAMKLTADNEARLYPIQSGAAIAIGPALVEEGDKQLRWRSLHALENPGRFDGCNASGLVFYNAARAEEAMRILRSIGTVPAEEESK